MLDFNSVLKLPGVSLDAAGIDGMLKSTEKDTFRFYKDEAGEFRWTRICFQNGEPVGAAHEGYKRKVDCVLNAIREGYRSHSLAIVEW